MSEKSNSVYCKFLHFLQLYVEGIQFAAKAAGEFVAGSYFLKSLENRGRVVGESASDDLFGSSFPVP